MRKKLLIPVAVAALLGSAAFSGTARAAQPEGAGGAAPTHAIAVLHPTEGNQVTGTVTFTRDGDAVKVVADVYGLTPGKHGFHIHQYGDCSAPDGSSAGGHFNPTHMPHAAPTDKQRHAGDFGNIVADSTGHAHFEWTDHMIVMSGANSIIGRGVVVHGGADDLTSQPSGNAGPRVACGVIGIARD